MDGATEQAQAREIRRQAERVARLCRLIEKREVFSPDHIQRMFQEMDTATHVIQARLRNVRD